MHEVLAWRLEEALSLYCHVDPQTCAHLSVQQLKAPTQELRITSHHTLPHQSSLNKIRERGLTIHTPMPIFTAHDLRTRSHHSRPYQSLRWRMLLPAPKDLQRILRIGDINGLSYTCLDQRTTARTHTEDAGDLR